MHNDALECMFHMLDGLVQLNFNWSNPMEFGVDSNGIWKRMIGLVVFIDFIGIDKGIEIPIRTEVNSFEYFKRNYYFYVFQLKYVWLNRQLSQKKYILLLHIIFCMGRRLVEKETEKSRSNHISSFSHLLEKHGRMFPNFPIKMFGNKSYPKNHLHVTWLCGWA